MTNAERRDKGMVYISDEQVFAEMAECKKKLKKLNEIDRWEYEQINIAAKDVIPNSQNLFVIPPFYCEYGTHISIGKNFFANYNCVMIDVAEIKIGDNCMFGPNVSLYTPCHPIHPITRNSGYECGKSITIGNNVWVGGSVCILPGVHIGNNVVIGAGSVVTSDIPDMVVAVGNPCRVIRKITDEDCRYFFKREEIDDEAWQNIVSKTNSDFFGNSFTCSNISGIKEKL